MLFRSDTGATADLLGVMRAECAAIGRDPADLEVTVGAHRPDHDLISYLEDIGVQRIVVPAPRPDSLRRRLEPLAELVGN